MQNSNAGKPEKFHPKTKIKIILALYIIIAGILLGFILSLIFSS
jgi:hypothetical protein